MCLKRDLENLVHRALGTSIKGNGSVDIALAEAS